MKNSSLLILTFMLYLYQIHPVSIFANQPSDMIAKDSRLTHYKTEINQRVGIALGIHYIFHIKSYLRQGWELGVPYVGLNAGLLIPIGEKLKLYPELHAKRMQQAYHESLQSESDLIIGQLSAALRYYYINTAQKQFYLNFGVGLFDAIFMTTLYEKSNKEPKDNSDENTIKNYEISKSYIGFGAIAGLGFQYRSSDKSTIDFGANYELTSFGDTMNGGLGDLGGIKLFIKAIFYL